MQAVLVAVVATLVGAMDTRGKRCNAVHPTRISPPTSPRELRTKTRTELLVAALKVAVEAAIGEMAIEVAEAVSKEAVSKEVEEEAKAAEGAVMGAEEEAKAVGAGLQGVVEVAPCTRHNLHTWNPRCIYQPTC
eukprot:963622-Prymnesium_polylepis.1